MSVLKLPICYCSEYDLEAAVKEVSLTNVSVLARELESVTVFGMSQDISMATGMFIHITRFA